MNNFESVSSRVSFSELEEKILEIWKKEEIFQRSINEKSLDKTFSFYEGPPTANGNPGIHHVLSRAFKDVIPRYKTMQGYRVARKGGWDTHGLPVELEVERQLGLSSKREIEEFGVAEFNAQCRESVFRYVSEWEKMTDRIGFWIDTENAYVTYSNDYIESAWSIIKNLWDNDLVFKDFRVTPHCPRCDTSLSSHEVALGYKEETPDPGVTVKFRISEKSKGRFKKYISQNSMPIFFLAWTTTPWTLSGNTALAISRQSKYSLVETENEKTKECVILASATIENLIGSSAKILAEFEGEELLNSEYEALYPDVINWVEPLHFVEGRTQLLKPDDPIPSRRIINSDEVAIDEGTGIIHMAPAFGEVDYSMGRQESLMFLQPVRSDGTLIGGPGDGMFAKEADTHIIGDLKSRGLLFKSQQIKHTYPFCWRCDQPILYYAKPSWYIRTTTVIDELISNNDRINWVPSHIKNGRFGGWLEGNVDWAISRERYWGTPLPIWICEKCGHIDCIGSFEELKKSGTLESLNELEKQTKTFDPHRPFIDLIKIPCANCNTLMTRTPEVADAWFDSGAMPYAQWHYPFENNDIFSDSFPADFICEAVDQTRGWFYTLHALATLLHHSNSIDENISFKNVICLGLILDGNGQKMSKSKGNVVNPWDVINKHGADAIRWYMYTASPPGNERRFSEDLVGETARRFLSTLWNTYSFFVTYANLTDFDPAQQSDKDGLSELDLWIRSELQNTVLQVTESLNAYELSEAARPIENFVNEMSNWYVRRSRRRFWRSGDDADSRSAFRTLYECLVTVAKLLAPFTPFISESIYQNLVSKHAKDTPDSVHLSNWPVSKNEDIDPLLNREMHIVQRMVSLGRAARSKANVRVRQPLALVIVVPRTEEELHALKRLSPIIAEELNVKDVDVKANISEKISYSVRPNLPVLGPKFGKRIKEISDAITLSNPVEIVDVIRKGEAVTLNGYELSGSDLIVDIEPIEGWAAAEDSGYLTLIDTSITPELRSEGLSREIVRRLQDLRRTANLDVTDRVDIFYNITEDSLELDEVIKTHLQYIASETLALSIQSNEPLQPSTQIDTTIEEMEITFALRASTQ